MGVWGVTMYDLVYFDCYLDLVVFCLGLFLLFLHVRSIFFYLCYFCMLRSFFFRRVLGCFPCTNMYANCTYYNMTVSRVGIEYPRLNFEHDGNKREL